MARYSLFLLIFFIVFGQSAGAMIIGSLLLADGGKAVSKLNLFRAAIMESGVPQGWVGHSVLRQDIVRDLTMIDTR